MYDPQSRALIDLAINIQTTSRNAIYCIITHPHLLPKKLDTTISEIFSIDTNPDSIFLQQFHSILPNLAAIACPPTIPQEQLCQYFLPTLSPGDSRKQQHITSSTTSTKSCQQKCLITSTYSIAGMGRSQISHRLPPLPFALNMRRKLRIPILPYECKCQCNKV